MKAIVIGGCGHIGTYLVPKLVRKGFTVVSVSRGLSRPYTPDPAWARVETVCLDRTAAPDFAERIARLDADVVVDLINFRLEDTRRMVEALKGTRLFLYLFCSSVWAHGRAELLGADPNCRKEPLEEYGREKYLSERYLKERYRQSGFPAAVVMPGQICGPGWRIINPYGNTDTRVFAQIARGGEICLPNFGMETLHHVHADDVAQMFVRAIENRDRALGESFHAVAEDSFTLYGYARCMYEFFGQTPRIKFLPWDAWREYLGDDREAEQTYSHIVHSGHFSIENARRRLGYRPRFSARETVEISVQSYIDRGVIALA